MCGSQSERDVLGRSSFSPILLYRNYKQKTPCCAYAFTQSADRGALLILPQELSTHRGALMWLDAVSQPSATLSDML